MKHIAVHTYLYPMPNQPTNNVASAATATQASVWHTLKHLSPYASRYKQRISIAALALVIAATATLAMPVAFRFLIDLGFTSSDLGGKQLSTLRVNMIFIGLFGLALVLAVSTALRFYFVAWLGERITADLRADVFTNVLRQDPVFFETLKSGEVLSRLSTDTTLIQTLVGTSISLGLRNTVLFTGSLIMMIYTSVSLASVIVGLLLVVVLPILFFGRRVRTLSRASQDRMADTGALAGETLNAIQTVQAYVRETMESARYAKATNQAFDAAITRNRSRSLLTVVAIVLVFGAIVFVLWLGAHAVLDGKMSAGLLAQFMMYAVLVGGSTGAIAEVLGDVQRAVGATEGLLELLNAEPTIRTRENPPILLSEPQQNSARFDSVRAAATPAQDSVSAKGVKVEFRNVCFSYPSRPLEQSLDNISFTIEPGDTVALVGPSGAGKTTVLQLLLRFYDPQSGSICLNGIALSEHALPELRDSIGFVSQDSMVFSANALDNIRYGKLQALDDDVYQAAHDAQAHEFIMRLPEGYNTYLGERGVRLSGGQRQRLSIARALLKNPPLLLLDEATSALDAESEHKVQTALERAMDGRTTLVIAHRLATIINADHILVIDSGRIAESGSHEELLRSSGLYARLAAMQFDTGLFNE